MASLLFARGMSDLVEDAAKITVSLRRTASSVFFRAFLLTGAGPDPGCQMGGRSKAAGLHAYFSNYLLGRVQPKTGNLRQPPHRLLMLLHGLADHDMELLDLLLKQLIAFEIKSQQLLLIRLEMAAESIHQS